MPHPASYRTRTDLVYTDWQIVSNQRCIGNFPFVLTLVYWNVSCLPVKVASMDWGDVSNWQIPGAAHGFEHKWASLVAYFSCSSEAGSSYSVLTHTNDARRE